MKKTIIIVISLLCLTLSHLFAKSYESKIAKEIILYIDNVDLDLTIENSQLDDRSIITMKFPKLYSEKYNLNFIPNITHIITLNVNKQNSIEISEDYMNMFEESFNAEIAYIDEKSSMYSEIIFYQFEKRGTLQKGYIYTYIKEGYSVTTILQVSDDFFEEFFDFFLKFKGPNFIKVIN